MFQISNFNAHDLIDYFQNEQHYPSKSSLILGLHIDFFSICRTTLTDLNARDRKKIRNLECFYTQPGESKPKQGSIIDLVDRIAVDVLEIFSCLSCIGNNNVLDDQLTDQLADRLVDKVGYVKQVLDHIKHATSKAKIASLVEKVEKIRVRVLVLEEIILDVDLFKQYIEKIESTNVSAHICVALFKRSVLNQGYILGVLKKRLSSIKKNQGRRNNYRDQTQLLTLVDDMHKFYERFKSNPAFSNFETTIPKDCITQLSAFEMESFQNVITNIAIELEKPDFDKRIANLERIISAYDQNSGTSALRMQRTLGILHCSAATKLPRWFIQNMWAMSTRSKQRVMVYQGNITDTLFDLYQGIEASMFSISEIIIRSSFHISFEVYEKMQEVIANIMSLWCTQSRAQDDLSDQLEMDFKALYRLLDNGIREGGECFNVVEAEKLKVLAKSFYMLSKERSNFPGFYSSKKYLMSFITSGVSDINCKNAITTQKEIELGAFIFARYMDSLEQLFKSELPTYFFLYEDHCCFLYETPPFIDQLDFSVIGEQIDEVVATETFYSGAKKLSLLLLEQYTECKLQSKIVDAMSSFIEKIEAISSLLKDDSRYVQMIQSKDKIHTLLMFIRYLQLFFDDLVEKLPNAASSKNMGIKKTVSSGSFDEMTFEETSSESIDAIEETEYRTDHFNKMKISRLEEDRITFLNRCYHLQSCERNIRIYKTIDDDIIDAGLTGDILTRENIHQRLCFEQQSKQALLIEDSIQEEMIYSHDFGEAHKSAVTDQYWFSKKSVVLSRSEKKQLVDECEHLKNKIEEFDQWVQVPYPLQQRNALQKSFLQKIECERESILPSANTLPSFKIIHSNFLADWGRMEVSDELASRVQNIQLIAEKLVEFDQKMEAPALYAMRLLEIQNGYLCTTLQCGLEKQCPERLSQHDEVAGRSLLFTHDPFKLLMALKEYIDVSQFTDSIRYFVGDPRYPYPSKNVISRDLVVISDLSALRRSLMQREKIEGEVDNLLTQYVPKRFPYPQTEQEFEQVLDFLNEMITEHIKAVESRTKTALDLCQQLLKAYIS